jgi:hypothetical protein
VLLLRVEPGGGYDYDYEAELEGEGGPREGGTRVRDEDEGGPAVSEEARARATDLISPRIRFRAVRIRPEK